MNNKNYIAEFMKENGLEIGEEFSIHDSSGFDNCFFCKDYSLSIASEDSFLDGETVLIELLSGQINPIKIKRQEYVEVDNSVDRMTDIQVRDRDKDKWTDAKFIFKLDDGDYWVYFEKLLGLHHYEQARMLKPTEPEFKEGELIEVRGIDDDTWVKREYLGKLNEFYICRSRGDVIGWEYARKIEER